MSIMEMKEDASVNNNQINETKQEFEFNDTEYINTNNNVQYNMPMMGIHPPPITMDDYINTPLQIDEKRKLRMDLLSLPPEKLGEIMYVLQKSQPQNIEQKGDELEIDLKKLNTKTLRHLQRYVESVFAKVRSNMNMNAQINNSQWMMLNADPNINQMAQLQNKKLSVSDLIPSHNNARKRTYGNMNSRYDTIANGCNPQNQRKKRSAFTTKQKNDMIAFWAQIEWKPVSDESILERAAANINITVSQLKVFRQNNRKKYGKTNINVNNIQRQSSHENDTQMSTKS